MLRVAPEAASLMEAGENRAEETVTRGALARSITIAIAHEHDDAIIAGTR